MGLKILFLIQTIMFIYSFTWADTTQSNSISYDSMASSYTDELNNKIHCAFEKNGLAPMPSKQAARAEHVAKYLSSVLTQIDPQWRDLATQHILAQTIAETSNLKNLSEQASEHDSSKSLYHGRGLIQITHKENYAKFAGCAKTIRNNPPPAKLSRETIAGSPALYDSQIVRNPDQAMSEKTAEGQELNTLSLVCFMVETAERHKALEKALQCSEINCIREVGVAVNHGPGDLGKGLKPLGDQARISAFNKMNSCFKKGNHQ
jgi:hypothetical protein